jgi:hypothetical protein
MAPASLYLPTTRGLEERIRERLTELREQDRKAKK